MESTSDGGISGDPAEMMAQMRATIGGDEPALVAWAETKRPMWKRIGYSDEEISTALKPPPAATPAPAEPTPAAPSPSPTESYADKGTPTANDKERFAIFLAEGIPNLELRQKTMSSIRATAADNRIIEGMTAHSREQAEKTAIGQYVQGIEQLVNDPKASYEQKGEIARLLMATARKDPRLAYGFTLAQLSKVMEDVAGIQHEEGMGRGFTTWVNRMANGNVTSQQLLKATESAEGADPELTTKGFTTLFERWQHINNPKVRLATHELNTALTEGKISIYGQGIDEANELATMRPTGIQKQKYQQFTNYILHKFGVLEAEGDVGAMSKFASSENIEKELESFYPKLQRHFDRVTQGQKTDIKIPGDVAPEHTKEATWIYGAPAEFVKDGKSAPTAPGKWAQSIEMLRRGAITSEQFKEVYPSADPEQILRMLGTVRGRPTVPAALAPESHWYDWVPKTMRPPEYR